ncbi:pentatricopeptide repeat-containing protein [Quercus suber]|uniref:Pentatricopeptide repeat-containing protein n=1 Tax=Quercus suber TaxID=58331 RepID=A0AAW0KUY0_QUESU
MLERNVRSWMVMIAGYVQCGKPKETIHLFMEMEEAGLRPNEVTVVAVRSACADLGGCLKDARRVFDEMEERTIVSWSAMTAGLAMHGQAKEALRLFSRTVQIGMKPNDVTFVGLLHACSHMGMIDKGREFFNSMTRNYGIIPRIEHYGCMVDLFKAEWWEDTAKVRRLMRDQGVKKKPGWSSITVDHGVLHESAAGDESYPQAEEIFQMWRKLLQKLKIKGYVPKTSIVLVIEENKKEKFLYRHDREISGK